MLICSIRHFTLVCVCLPFRYCLGQTTALLRLSDTMRQTVVRKPYLQQFADPNHSYSLSTIRRLPIGRWLAVNTINFGSQGSPGWAMFQLQSSTRQAIWLEVNSHFIDSVQIWLVREPNTNNASVTSYKPTGFRVLPNDREAPIRNRYVLKALPLLPGVQYAVYIRAWVPPGDVLKFDLTLWHPAAFREQQQQDMAYWGIFVGLVLMSVFITGVSYVFHPQYIYLYYIGYISCMSIYAILNDGWGLYLPTSLRWLDNTCTVMHWISFGVFFLLLFTHRFLAIPTKATRWWLRFSPIWLLLFLEGAILMADYGVSRHHFELVRASFLIGFSVVAVYALLWLSYVVDAVQRQFRPVWLYLASVLVWLVFYITNIFVVNTGWLTDPFPDMLVFRVAILIEVSLIFIGWMYRQRIIRQSEKRLQLLEQTRQQELFYSERRRQAEELKALRLQTELQQQRERLARDLHDGIGSQLTHIAGRLDILSIRHPNEQLQLKRLCHFVRETNQALRDTVWILNCSHIRLSTFSQRLHAYLLRLWEDLDQPRLDWCANLPVNDALIVDPVLSPLAVQSLFRIAQEAVNNALKYAGATTICISLTNQQTTIQLTITDNGAGFDPTTVSHGYGLTNMQKRAEEIGAGWTLTSCCTGTQIQVSLLHSG